PPGRKRQSASEDQASSGTQRPFSQTSFSPQSSSSAHIGGRQRPSKQMSSPTQSSSLAQGSTQRPSTQTKWPPQSLSSVHAGSEQTPSTTVFESGTVTPWAFLQTAPSSSQPAYGPWAAPLV